MGSAGHCLVFTYIYTTSCKTNNSRMDNTWILAFLLCICSILSAWIPWNLEINQMTTRTVLPITLLHTKCFMTGHDSNWIYHASIKVVNHKDSLSEWLTYYLTMLHAKLLLDICDSLKGLYFLEKAGMIIADEVCTII